jgi:hypothetical protein
MSPRHDGGPGRLPAPAAWTRGGVALLLLLGPAQVLLRAPRALRMDALPGDGRLPDAIVGLALRAGWYARGAEGWLADGFHGFPTRGDHLVDAGLPLDAVLGAPLVAALGLARGEWALSVLVGWLGSAAIAAWALRWHGRTRAALVAAATWMAGEPTLRHLAAGRTNVLLAAGLAITAAWLAWEARCAPAGGRGVPIRAACAGVTCGLAAGTDPNLAVPAVLAVALPWLLARPRTPRETGAMWSGLAGFAAIVAPLAAWVVSHATAVPALGADPFAPLPIDMAPVRPVDLVTDELWGKRGVVAASLLRPTAWLLVAAALALAYRRNAPRAVLVPAALLGVGAAWGVGAVLPGPVLTPAGLLLRVPVLARCWWSDHAWLVAWGGVGLLAGACVALVPARLRTVLTVLAVGGLAGEAAALSPSLPVQAIPLVRTPLADALAERAGPLVLLPAPGGRLRTDRGDLVDQLHHGRPLVAGLRPLLDPRAPAAELRAWSGDPALQAFVACEQGRAPDATPATIAAALARLGVSEVVLDTHYVARAPTYVTCVEGALRGWTEGGRGRLRWWRPG